MTMPSRQRRVLLLILPILWLSGCAESIKSIGTGAIDYVDPLSSNWELAEHTFPDNRVKITLTMKRYYTGGAGEARAIGLRRASELMHAGGYASYEILEYSESIDSSQFGSKRRADLFVRLIPAAGR